MVLLVLCALAGTGGSVGLSSLEVVAVLVCVVLVWADGGAVLGVAEGLLVASWWVSWCCSDVAVVLGDVLCAGPLYV